MDMNEMPARDRAILDKLSEEARKEEEHNAALVCANCGRARKEHVGGGVPFVALICPHNVFSLKPVPELPRRL